MIITAKLARQQANEVQAKPDNRVLHSIRQLSEIEKTINRASKQGKKSINYYKELYCDVHITLINNGYKILKKSDWNCGEWIEINWE